MSCGPRGYSKRFRSPAEASRYDEAVYQKGSVSDLLWRVEKDVLSRLLEQTGLSHEEPRFLDFACGTGRILGFVAPSAGQALGMDISPEMLARARQRLPTVPLVCWDLSAGSELLQRGYDLITSFRFLTNAEPELRRLVLRQLAGRLNAHGRIILNIHANPLSYRGLLIPFYWAREKLTGQKMLQHLTRHRTVRELRAAGLEIERVVGLGFVSGRLLRFLPFQLALALERRLAGFPGLQYFGVNQVFVCRKAR